ncbi:MAG: preprotein translocase subunit SecE [Myxococcales bacterium]|nr:preprotein translocase subunit SecE [Myxococcales bacterium]
MANAETKLEPSAPAGEGGAEDKSQQARALGLLRWVQMAYMVIAVLLLWVSDKLITLVWSKFAEPDSALVTLISVAVGFGVAFRLYKHEKFNRATHEVVGELAKVTWPSRRETQVSTVVVIITSMIAAAILGAFDAVWSTITDLIYKV